MVVPLPSWLLLEQGNSAEKVAAVIGFQPLLTTAGGQATMF